MRYGVRAVLVAVLGLALGLLQPVLARAAYSEQGYADRVLELVNDYRAEHGLVALRPASGTNRVAAAWTQRMIDDGQLAHNPDLEEQIEANGSPNWGVFGENVGRGDPGYPERLFQAYVDSPSHHENLLTPEYRYVGHHVIFSGGRSWHTMDFVDRYGTTATPRPSASARPTPTRPVARPPAPPPRRVPATSSAPRPSPSPTRVVPLVPAATPSAEPSAAVGPAAALARPAERVSSAAGHGDGTGENPWLPALAAALAATVGAAWGREARLRRRRA